MSAPPSAWLSNSNYNKFKGSYFNSDVDCSGGNIICRNGNLYLAPNSNIYTTNNKITFNDVSNNIDVSNNLTVKGNFTVSNGIIVSTTPTPTTLSNLKLSYLQDVTANIQGQITPLQTKLTNITYTSGTNTTAFTGTLSFPNGSIGNSALATTYVDLTNVQTITANKKFTDLQINGSLYLNAGVLTIPQANLQKIQYLSNVTTDISGSITSLQTQINNINTSALLSTANSWSSLQTFNGNIKFPANGTISSTSNTITFDDTYAYTNFSNNVHIYGTQQLDYGGTTYDVGYDIVNTRYLLTNVSYDSGTNTTTIGGNLSITGYVPDNGNSTIAGIKTFSSAPVLSGASITSGTIPDSALTSTFISATATQSGITGVKGFNDNINCSASVQITSTGATQGLRLDGVLRLGGNTLTIQQATIQKLQYLSTLSSDVQTQINNCAKTNAANTFGTGQQTITNSLRLDGSLLLNAGATTISNTILTYLSGLTSNIQAQINSISTSNFMDLISTQTASGLKSFSSLLTASAGIATNAITSAGNLVLTTANTFSTFINSSKTSGDVRINYSSPNSNTYIDNGSLYITPSTTGVNFFISQPNTTSAGIYSGSLTGSSATDYCEGMYLLNNGYGAEIQGGKLGTTTDVFNLGHHNNGTVLNFISAQNTTGTASNNPIQINGQVSITGGLSLNGNYGILSYQPIGTIIHNVSASCGLPLLLCNGQAVSRTTYAGLFAIISTAYGAGDGSTTFNIPNYSGAFLRGMGSQTPASITYASDVNPAQYQADQLRSHTHNGQSGSYLNTGTSAVTINGYSAIATTRPTSSTFASTGGVNSGGNGAETRPFNFGIYMYIRAL